MGWWWKRFCVDAIYDTSLEAIPKKIHLSQAGVANGSIVERHEPLQSPSTCKLLSEDFSKEAKAIWVEQWEDASIESLPSADGVSDSLTLAAATVAFHRAHRCVSIDQCEAPQQKPSQNNESSGNVS